MTDTIEKKCLSKGVKLTDQRKVIVKVFAVGVGITWNSLSSKSDAFNPVPLGKVTESNKTISPSSKLCAADVVIVIVGVPLKVNVAPAIEDVKGVISKNWASKI